MGLDLDEIYYTETMVKILLEQGHSQLAMELAEEILAKKGDVPKVRALLDDMKEDARRAFERFKNSGRAGEREATELSEPSVEVEVSTEPEAASDLGESAETAAELSDAEEIGREVVRLTLVAERREPSSQEKIERLQQLLERVLKRRENHEIQQA